jgi:manganese transport protein
VRRIMTRLLAIVPAVITITVFGEGITGKLLVFSQVVLSLQLGFAIIPLIHFVSDKTKMKGFHISRITQLAAWLIATIIVSLNAKLVYDEIKGWLEISEHPIWIWLTVVPLAVAFLVLLLFIVVKPFIIKPHEHIYNHSPHSLKLRYARSGEYEKKNIAVTVDFSEADENALNNAFALGGTEANYTLIHVVETVGAIMYGDHIVDHETSVDEQLLQEYDEMLTAKGYKIQTKLGFGHPGKGIPKIVNEGKFDVLVMGTHGHSGVKDLLFGTTVGKVRHGISIPLVIVKKQVVGKLRK